MHSDIYQASKEVIIDREDQGLNLGKLQS
jgi:hypothetical protein